ALEPPNASSGCAREWLIERRSRSSALLRRVPRQRASGACERSMGKRRDHSDRCERRAAREAGVAGGSPRQEPQREPAASHALAPSSGVLQHLGHDRKERTQGLRRGSAAREASEEGRGLELGATWRQFPPSTSSRGHVAPGAASLDTASSTTIPTTQAPGERPLRKPRRGARRAATGARRNDALGVGSAAAATNARERSPALQAPESARKTM